MSDVEEPPTKMSKYEEYLEEECLEEDEQEEWLSEGVLTDDDYHISMPDPDKTDSNLDSSHEEQETMISQEIQSGDQSMAAGDQILVGEDQSTAAGDESMVSEDQNMVAMDQMEEVEGTEEVEASETVQTELEDVKTDLNIEDTLNNLDGKNGLPEDTLDTFLIRKTDGKLVKDEKEEAPPSKVKVKEEDDGNDTDDLLRLLEDGQQQKKKTLKIVNVKSEKMEDLGSSDDDEYIYERSKVKTLRLAKNAVIKRVPSKAVPEDSDSDEESDGSSDEIGTMKRMFGVKMASPKPAPNSKSIQSKTSQNGKPEPKKIVKHVVQVNTNYTKPHQLQKIAAKPTKFESKPAKEFIKTAPSQLMQKETKSIFKKMDEEEMDEIIDEEEFLEDDDIELDEGEFGDGSEGSGSERQHIMKPEMMDEEVPSDEDSHSEDEDGSLYDELPSSDSEDMDDWFTLDIRAETAADYLPLLGTCARSLLTAERKRAQARVDSLRKSLSALTDSARRQADSLKQATMTLAEIDDTLRAA